MLSENTLLAIVPARAGSKGLPGKNKRIFCGKPLLQWSVENAIASSSVTKVIVSTDSEEIAEIACACGAEVPFLRPENLASDTSTSVDVILHAVDFLEDEGERFSYVVLLEPTSPLRKAEDIDDAFQLLCNYSEAESIVSVSRTEGHHPAFLMKKTASGFLQPFCSSLQPIRRQDISPVFFLDGTLYISRTQALRNKKSFYHELTLGYEVPKYQSFEIDDEDDFIICEALYRYRFKNN